MSIRPSSNAYNIYDIRIEGDEAYSSGNGLPTSFPATLPSVDEESGARPQRDFKVEFRPVDIVIYQAGFITESSDSIANPIRIPIVGRGTAN